MRPTAHTSNAARQPRWNLRQSLVKPPSRSFHRLSARWLARLLKTAKRSVAADACRTLLLAAFVAVGSAGFCATPVDVVPFGLPLPEGNGVCWEDPREIHQVVVHFKGAAPPPDRVKLEYWGSHWPEEHLPKDKDIGSGGSGWMEL